MPFPQHPTAPHCTLVILLGLGRLRGRTLLPELEFRVGRAPGALGSWDTLEAAYRLPGQLCDVGSRCLSALLYPMYDRGELPRCAGVFPELSLKVPEACTENPRFQVLVLTGPLTHVAGRKRGPF